MRLTIVSLLVVVVVVLKVKGKALANELNIEVIYTFSAGLLA